jgi:flagellar assembly protein FliH
MFKPVGRRPRFLAAVPEIPTPAAAGFLHVEPRGGPGAPVPHGGPAAQQAPPPPAPDLAALRREALERVSNAVETLRAHADRLAEQARSDALEIGFQVARRILETELRQSPDALFALVRSAIRRAGESRRVAVRVPPEDASALQSESGRAALDGLTAARIELVPDPSLQPGDCVVDTDFGQVDGRLGTRLSEVRRAVAAAAEGGAA